MSMPWVILVNYKGAADTIECVESLRKHAPDAIIVVVENGSADDSASQIRLAHPSVRLIESPTNLGFTGGNNLAIQIALAKGAEYVWMLNNDTVVEPGAVDELLRVMQSDSSIGILSPRIDYYDAPGAPWFVGAKMDLSRGEAVHENASIPTEVVDVPWITGCAMFCRAEMLRKTGGFDDRYFLNWEDVDLSLRAAKLGWKLKLAPRAIIRHKVSRSLAQVSRLATYYWVRNRLLLTHRHGGRYATMKAAWDSLRGGLRAVRHGRVGSWTGLKAVLQGSYDAFRGRYGARSA
jgi:GT2 family glycosyltransferase